VNVTLENGQKIDFLNRELKNFQEIARCIKPLPGEVPRINGIDIFGAEIPFNGVVGGDHIVYVDFNRRYDLDHRIQEARDANRPDIVEQLELNKRRAGVMLADVAGHQVTDAMLAGMLHQAFLTGVQYELKNQGQVTSELFEILNTRFFNSSSVQKFITLIYGEIHESGEFKFINAGHPPPVVFSNKFDKLIKVCYERVLNFPPIGTLPSKDDIDVRRNFSYLGYKQKYSVNSINLMGQGDILLLYTDGLSEHSDESDRLYFSTKLEETLKQVKFQAAKDIYFHIKEDLLNFGRPNDDISFVIIKKE
jgi:serine phosphatase RsbU (regulator of sigma subunit)